MPGKGDQFLTSRPWRRVEPALGAGFPACTERRLHETDALPERGRAGHGGSVRRSIVGAPLARRSRSALDVLAKVTRMAASRTEVRPAKTLSV